MRNDNQKIETSSDMEELKRFLLDISCLDTLSEWTDHFNLFDVLKLSRHEIRHSNLLAWLLNPNENHGLGPYVLEGFIQHALPGLHDDSDVFSTLLMDFRSFIVLREWQNIDILAISESEQFVLCIENKIGSGEHDNQLDRYQNTITTAYPEYKHLFVFLSPEGVESSNPEVWYSMSYSDVITIIESAKQRTVISPQAEMLIDQYLETIRRDIMGDEKLSKICREIYSKHQRALDLIFENRPDRMTEIADIFKSWAAQKTEEGELIFAEDHCNKTNTRFTTKVMSAILPEEEDALSGWGSKSDYYYEIHQISEEKFRMQFVVSSKNLSEQNQRVCDILDQYFYNKKKKEDWQWRTYYATSNKKVSDELSKQQIYKALDDLWKELKRNEENIVSVVSAHLSTDEGRF